jgi:hypothetical protein
MVVAVIALFSALAGPALADQAAQIAKKLNGSSIKTRSVAGNKLKNNTVTGKQIKESSLATVSKATSATNATNATNATSADSAKSLNGRQIRLINFRGTTATGTELLNLGGLIIRLNCAGGGEVLLLDTTGTGGEISSISTDASNDTIRNAFDDNFNPGDNLDATAVASASDRIYNIVYTPASGDPVTANLVTEDDIGANNCIVNGYAIG